MTVVIAGLKTHGTVMTLLRATMTACGLALMVALAACGDGEKQVAEGADSYPVGRPVPGKVGFAYAGVASYSKNSIRIRSE